MSEVEKMYENAEVKKQIPKVCSSNELYCKECKAHIEDAMPYCKNAEYPPFTANKQLELIKWLIKYDELHADFNDNEYGFSTLNYSGKYRKDFDDALANVINFELWQDLTEQERKQIADILKG